MRMRDDVYDDDDGDDDDDEDGGGDDDDADDCLGPTADESEPVNSCQSGRSGSCTCWQRACRRAAVVATTPRIPQTT